VVHGLEGYASDWALDHQMVFKCGLQTKGRPSMLATRFLAASYTIVSKWHLYLQQNIVLSPVNSTNYCTCSVGHISSVSARVQEEDIYLVTLT